MYCIYCGKPIPDGGKCNCKDPVPSYKPEYPYSPTPMVAPYTPPEYTYNYQKPQLNDSFCDNLKVVFGSPLMLIFAILSCLAFVLDIISFNFNILLILTIIGAFLIYSNSRNKNAITSKTGYTLLWIVNIVNFATYCIVALSLFIPLIRTVLSGAMDEGVTYIVRLFNDDFKHSIVRLTPLANISICIIVFAIILLIFLYLLTLNSNLVYIRRRISSPEAKGTYRNFPNVMLIIHGVTGFFIGMIIINEQALISQVMYDILYSNMSTVYKILSVSLKFGIPLTLMVMSIARILAGITLCRFNARFKRMK